MNELISKRKPLYTITSGDIEAADLPIGIDAAKIADGSVSNTEFQYVNGVTSAIQTQLGARLPLAGGTMTGAIVLHADPSSAMHAATKQYVDAATGSTYTADETTLTLAGTVFSIKTSGVANTQISAAAAIDLSKLATVTASRALVSTAGGVVSASSVTATELGYVSGVTSAIQTQLNAKQATITGAATSIVSSNLTVSSALVSDGSGKVAVSAVTATELGYVSGVTSAIQTQLGARLPLAGGTMTGAIVLHADPSSAMHAATKQYVDATAGTTYTADETTLTLSGTVFSIKTSGVANTQISAAAAIDLSKLAAVTASRALVSTAGGVVSASSVTATELGYVSGVTSAIQTQLNAKQATITGAATSIVSSNLTVSSALVSDGSGKVAVSAVTATELGYVSGVTSAIQTQLNAKQATITGGATTIAASDLTASRALVSDVSGKVGVSAVTATELGSLSGVTGTLVSTTGTQTLTNKTVNLTSNTISGTIAQFNTACSDADFATLTGTETLTGKTINLSSNTLTGSISQFNTACSDADFATLAGTETLTAKTINLTSNTLTGTTAQFNTALSDGDFCTLAGTETLTNKTLTSPKIATILDANGNEHLKFTTVASAVNEVVISNNVTTANPYITASGNDTNISLGLSAKGTGCVVVSANLCVSTNSIVDGNFNEYFKFASTASAVNEITVTNAAAGGAVKLEATGGSTNIDFHIGAKGTGVLYVSSGDLWLSGYFKPKAIYSDKVTATDGATVTFNLANGNDHSVILGGNRTLALTGAVTGQWFNVILQQDGTGSRTVTWWTTINWAGGSAPTLTTTANKMDILGFYCISSGVYVGRVIAQNISS